MRAASATERILLVDDVSPAAKGAARQLVVWSAAEDTDIPARRLPACDSVTERWESGVFLILGLAGIIGVGLAVFNAL
jgi:hypothetical protein